MANWVSVWSNGSEAQNWTNAQRQQNVNIIASYLNRNGWTYNAIAGLVGNMQAESYLNPAQWELGRTIESYTENNIGFGLVQWTPWWKYADWAGSDWRTNFDKQLGRLMFELEMGEGYQWIATADYPMSFEDFTHSRADPDTLAMVFFKNYERGVGGEAARQQNAINWYDYLMQNPPGPVPVNSSNFNIMLYLKPNWKRRK